MLLLRQRAAAGDADAASLLQRIDEGVARVHAGEDPSVLDAEVEALRQHEVVAETEATAKAWAADAVAAIDVLPKSVVKTGLERFAESIVSRKG